MGISNLSYIFKVGICMTLVLFLFIEILYRLFNLMFTTLCNHLYFTNEKTETLKNAQGHTPSKSGNPDEIPVFLV